MQWVTFWGTTQESAMFDLNRDQQYSVDDHFTRRSVRGRSRTAQVSHFLWVPRVEGRLQAASGFVACGRAAGKTEPIWLLWHPAQVLAVALSYFQMNPSPEAHALCCEQTCEKLRAL